MWQLEMHATKPSSGSTPAGFDHGAGTTEGDGEAGTITPPSKDQVCSREYLPLAKSSGAPLRAHLMTALCSDMARSPLDPSASYSCRPARACASWRACLAGSCPG